MKKVAGDLNRAIDALGQIHIPPDIGQHLAFLGELKELLPDMAHDIQVLTQRQEKLEGVLRVLIKRTAGPSEIPKLLALLSEE